MPEETTEPQPENVLGVDTEEPTLPETISASSPGGAEPETPSKSNMHQITEDEYSSLLERASGYDLIEADPVLYQTCIDHLRNRGAVTESGSEDNVDVGDDPRFKAIDDRMKKAEIRADNSERLLREAVAAIALEQFRAGHPDVADFKDEMATLIQKNGMDIPTAYKYAKLAKQASSQSSPSVPAPTVEGRGAGIVTEGGVDSVLEAAEKEINDPKATASLGDAFDKALKAAIQTSGDGG